MSDRYGKQKFWVVLGAYTFFWGGGTGQSAYILAQRVYRFYYLNTACRVLLFLCWLAAHVGKHNHYGGGSLTQTLTEIYAIPQEVLCVA